MGHGVRARRLLILIIRRAVVLGGGKASRLAAVAGGRPKPMLPVGGRPLVEHTIRQLAANGVREIGMNLYQNPAAVIDHFGDGQRFDVRMHYSIEPEPTGTAGALRAFREMVADEPFFVIYGDNLTTCDFNALARAHERYGGKSTMALFWRDDVTKHSAVEVARDMRIRRFIEKPKAEEAPSHWISAGMMVLDPDVLRYIPAEGAYDIGFHLFPELLRAGEPVYGYYMQDGEGLWWIDTPEDYDRISRLCEKGFPP